MKPLSIGQYSLFNICSLYRSRLTLILILALHIPLAASAEEYDCKGCQSDHVGICKDECSLDPNAAPNCRQKCIEVKCRSTCEAKPAKTEQCLTCEKAHLTTCLTGCPTSSVELRRACQLKCVNEKCSTKCAENEDSKSGAKQSNEMTPPAGTPPR